MLTLIALNDKYFEGKSNDLSKFGTNVGEWTKVRLEVKQRVARIFLNDTLIREEIYTQNGGNIVVCDLVF